MCGTCRRDRRAADNGAILLITIEGRANFTAGNDLGDFWRCPIPAPPKTFLSGANKLGRNQVPVVAAVSDTVIGDHAVFAISSLPKMPVRDAVRGPGAGAEAASSCLPALPAAACRHLLLGGRSALRKRSTWASPAIWSRRSAERRPCRAVALLAKPPRALRQTQRLLRREDIEEILERMELENGHFAERLQSDEVKAAIAAFFAARARPAA